MAPRAKFDKYEVHNGKISRGFKSWPAADCTVTVESGEALRTRVSKGRVAGGAILFGPAGAIVGALAKKKSGGDMLLLIEVPGDAFVLDVPPKKIKDAHKFAAVAAQYKSS